MALARYLLRTYNQVNNLFFANFLLLRTQVTANNGNLKAKKNLQNIIKNSVILF